MCILTFATRFCERFPFVLIGNRDEQLGRGTSHLRYDVQTGLVWAVDQLAGGSWMGIEPISGRFTILTNCRRAAAAPLTRASSSSSSSGHDTGASTVLPVSPLPPTVPALAHAAHAAAVNAVREKVASDVVSPAMREAAADWRGAAPLSHILRHTRVVPVRPALRSEAHPNAVTLLYDPPTSRGSLIKNFLLSGELPEQTGNSNDNNDNNSSGNRPSSSSSLCPPQSPLTAPFYAGFNLLTCDSLRTAAPLCYTSNRFGVQYRCPVPPGAVHVLQNSFLDNTAGEPISARLRDLFNDALHEVLLPLEKDPSTAVDVVDVATRLADACLCDRSDFDIAQMMNGEAAGDSNASSSPSTADKTATAAAAVRATVHSTNPLLGFSEAELQAYFGADASSPLDFTDGGAARVETYLQSNILKKPLGGHGTRVQSMVLVERVPVSEAVGGSTGGSGGGAMPAYTEVIHFCQRDVSFEGPQQTCVGAPWIAFRINADGSFAREAEEAEVA